ncbi:MAG: hypothetical protein LBG76_05025 [Treponema sp.]|jgi:uncharacterized integral membrane protein|nr:hypothetical protein [Treponema sp.]
MPWRFLGFIIASGIFLVFIGLNLENRSDVSFGFIKISQAPVYLTVFTSFVLGMLCSLPIVVSVRFRRSKNRGKNSAQPGVKKRGKKEPLKESLEESPHANDGTYGID